ncbi:MAG: LptF/LptG family permease [Bacteroidia bacterium]|uniref:LptF/LptG family permease n=1 Tax=Candidatus Pollutiaquabacter sp. TaxID=3416354 RepID=UPI001A388034|nr:LptF/LptG family permease [Bacteroidota bacterium]MBL7948409.1 LptF/LptG family permease [Bacteroidia bacterium]MBP6009745.1 LptF/LptG family permease [Bacteroidia bacterium]MBP7270121.1 LptF/LptG family permease [Bacteroidia bacterium]MBP7436307.1 LptF/LptG family permease [Bacteroidia bacterium]
MKILDRYIIRKFLGTFFFSLALIILIAVIFDISEKIDDFIERKAPFSKIVFDYYFNFIPYFANLFAPLFVFISVIYFTARMAANTEIVAILNSGISFRRMLRPYFMAAGFLAALSFYFNGWVIPHSNKVKLEFENVYIKNPVEFKDRNIHRQISPGVYMYMESYNNVDNIGYRFSLERIEDGKRVWFLNSDRIVWDSTASRWKIENYYIRRITGFRETLTNGWQLDTTLSIKPADFRRRLNIVDAMDTPALSAFIEEEKISGSESINSYLVEKYRRIALPFSTFILMLIGVSLSSRKVRGGIGSQLGLGITLSFAYILFMQVANTFAISGSIPAMIAVWIPNIVFAFVAVYLLRVAPK